MKVNNKSKTIYSKKQIDKINKKINLLGVNSKYNAITLLNVRLFGAIFIFLFILINYKYGYIFSIIIALLYYALFEKVILENKISKRRKKLNIEAIYFFEVLTLSLQKLYLLNSDTAEKNKISFISIITNIKDIKYR